MDAPNDTLSVESRALLALWAVPGLGPKTLQALSAFCAGRLETVDEIARVGGARGAVEQPFVGHQRHRSLDEIRRQHLKDFRWGKSIDRLTGSDKARLAIDGGTLSTLLEGWQREAEAFRQRRRPFLLYE